MATQPMIEVESLTKYYGSFPAITDVSFTVGKGEILGFLVFVNGPVEFDNETQSGAAKISNKLSDRMLSPKFQPIYFPTTYLFPQQSFCPSLSMP